MSQRVVDGLEPIEIEAVQRQSTTATHMRQGLHRLVEQHAIGQIGQCIMMRLMGNPGLVLDALGDLLIGRQPALLHRLVRPFRTRPSDRLQVRTVRVPRSNSSARF